MSIDRGEEARASSRDGLRTLVSATGGVALVTVVLLALIDQLLSVPACMVAVDRFRPPFGETSLRVHAEGQMWHVETLARIPVGARVAVVGSSSVVNGVDTETVGALIEDQGKPAIHNLGLTGLLAYELPSIAKYVFTPATRGVVYLYNGFSFGNAWFPDAVPIRWDTIEMLQLAARDDLQVDDVPLFASALIDEHVRLFRYRNFLRAMLLRAVTGRLRIATHPFDYDPGLRAPDGPRTRSTVEPLPRSDLLRAAYLDSSELDDTLGYRGLRRFCDIARSAGSRLLIAPVPEPDFALIGKYAQGTDRATVDRKVRATAEDCGATYVPRDYVRALEQMDGLFLDHVHLTADGRDMFSRILATKLNELWGRR